MLIWADCIWPKGAYSNQAATSPNTDVPKNRPLKSTAFLCLLRHIGQSSDFATLDRETRANMLLPWLFGHVWQCAMLGGRRNE